MFFIYFILKIYNFDPSSNISLNKIDENNITIKVLNIFYYKKNSLYNRNKNIDASKIFITV